jgi:hypothetical protein
MTRQEIVDLVESQGGYVSLKQAGDGRPLAVFSPFIGCDARCGTESWEFSILLIPEASGWTIRFGPRAADTRPLTTGELKQVLVSWLNAPDPKLFATYERDA